MRAPQVAGRIAPSRDEARPPHAVVGSQIDNEEEIFAAFDGRIIRRFWQFVSPYRRRLLLALATVLVFALSQVAIPLILRAVVDSALAGGNAEADMAAERLLLLGVAVFFAVVTLNFLANLVQETLVARIATPARRSASGHVRPLQRVSLSFMDKTEVGRLMSGCRATSMRCRNSSRPPSSRSVTSSS
ncbi:MAG: hypothetical protein R3C69_08150 [Geminicoccaceae bacterium]